MTNKTKRSPWALMFLAAAMVGTGLAVPASAGISFVNMFRNDAYTQNGDGNSLSSLGVYLTFNLFTANPNDYSSAQVTFVGPASPATMSATTPSIFGYSTGYYPSRVALDADFPAGVYTYAATNGSTTDTTSVVYSVDAYSSTLPFLTGTDYSDLQGMNPAAPFAFHFSPMTPSPLSTEALMFFTVFDAVTGDVVYDAGFLPSTTADVTVPANTLAPGVQYAYQLTFSDRVSAASLGADFDAQFGFDEPTSGLFIAVPEPTAGLMLVAFAGAAALRRRRIAG